jgi:hypothetical protein
MKQNRPTIQPPRFNPQKELSTPHPVQGSNPYYDPEYLKAVVEQKLQAEREAAVEAELRARLVQEAVNANKAAQASTPAGNVPTSSVRLDRSEQQRQQIPNVLGPAEAEQQGEYMDLMKKQYLRSLEDQAEGVQRQQAHIDSIKAMPQEADLGAAYKLVDILSQNKTDYAKQYKAPASALDRAEMIAKLENQLQASRGRMSSTDIALLKASLQPPTVVLRDNKWQIDAGNKPPPPPRVDREGAATEKQTEKYIKEIEGAQDVLDKAKEIQALMPQVKDLGEQSWGSRAGSLAQAGVNSLLGTDVAFTDEQARFKQLQDQFTYLKQLLQSGRSSTDKEFRRLAVTYGGMVFSSKRQVAAAINDIITTLQTKVKGAATAFPKGAKAAGEAGLVTPESFKDVKVTPTPAGGTDKASKRPKPEQYPSKEAYLKALKEYTAGLKK